MLVGHCSSVVPTISVLTDWFTLYYFVTSSKLHHLILKLV
jgi:hypothetical protein